MTDTPFAVPAPGYTDDAKICAYCGGTYFRYGKCSAGQWARQVSCSAKKCRSIRESMRQRRMSAAGSGKPKDQGREAELYRGLAYEDDPRAVRSEPRFTRLPEPTLSLMGNGTAMCEGARRT